MSNNNDKERTRHEHRGKTSEEFLDKTKILSSLGISEGQTILDAGSGSGYMSREFAHLVKNTGKVYAMDTDEISIANMMKTISTNTIEPVVGDITQKTKLGESSVDLIYLSMVMHGLSETQIAGFITETKRLLKPKGILAILEFKKEDTTFGPPLNIRLSPTELIDKIPLKPKRTIDIGEYCYIQLFEK